MLKSVIAVCVLVAVAPSDGVARTSHKSHATTPAAARDGAGATPLSPKEELTYELGPGDKLNVITFDEPQLTGTFYVGANGMVSFPWIGDVPAKGRTLPELRDDIVARLRDGYILSPQVTLQVMVYRPFYILGEVNRPGEYPYASGLTVMEAVATAQGFTYRANKKRVYIKRPGGETEITLPLSAATAVEPGDTIRIGERYF